MHQQAIVGLLIAVGLAFALGAAAPQEQKFNGDVLRGRQVFVDRGCVRCHAVLGSGGTAGPDLAEASKGMSFFDMLGRLWSHSPVMVAAVEQEGLEWPKLAGQEMDDLLAYLYYLNYFDKPGDFRRGERIFTQKGCIRCHAVGHAGQEIGPSLDPYGSQASPVAMVAAMWNHGPNMSLKMAELSVTAPVFEGTDVADLLAYIRGVTVTSSVRREYVAPGDPARGRELFSEAGCTRCHAVRGDGGASESTSIGPDLAESDLQHSVSELAGIMWNHGPIMWQQMRDLELPIITFEPTDMAHVIAYLYFINYYSETGDAANGEQLFVEKGCVVCHPFEGAGELVGPDLSKSNVPSRPARFAASIWNHAPAMLETAEAKILAWPEFRNGEMGDLHAYLKDMQDH